MDLGDRVLSLVSLRCSVWGTLVHGCGSCIWWDMPSPRLTSHRIVADMASLDADTVISRIMFLFRRGIRVKIKNFRLMMLMLQRVAHDLIFYVFRQLFEIQTKVEKSQFDIFANTFFHLPLRNTTSNLTNKFFAILLILDNHGVKTSLKILLIKNSKNHNFMQHKERTCLALQFSATEFIELQMNMLNNCQISNVIDSFQS